MNDTHSNDDPRHAGTLNDGGAGTEPTESPATHPAEIPWLRATAADVRDLDFEILIADSTSATTYELSEQYRRAAQPLDAGASAPDTPETRLFTMLSAVTGMHLKAHERDEPYGPHITLADGRSHRSPCGFSGRPCRASRRYGDALHEPGAQSPACRCLLGARPAAGKTARCRHYRLSRHD
jgi:hypothetical protein